MQNNPLIEILVKGLIVAFIFLAPFFIFAIVIYKIKKKLGFVKKNNRRLKRNIDKENSIYTPVNILTDTEFKFYTMLRKLIKPNEIIQSKVRVEDIINVKKGIYNYQGERNRIKSLHVDFLVCDIENLQIKYIIELDDFSHENEVAQRKDEFKNNIFDEIGIILLRFDCRNYGKRSIKKAIQRL